MFKKKFTLILFLFLNSCGFEAIHSLKNSVLYDFSIKELTLTGERNINLRIKAKLNNYTLVEKDRKFSLEILSSTVKTTIAKNAAGDATRFQSTLTLDVQAITENNYVKNFKVIESFNYDYINNTLDLKRYEREINNNLAETATDKLIFRLSNIR